MPAALAAAIVIYLGALAFGTVYTSAKALAIAAPLITLISFGGLLARASAPSSVGGDPRVRHWRRSALALALAAGIALSSFLVLRQAPVAPQDHADQLAELRPLVQGQQGPVPRPRQLHRLRAAGLAAVHRGAQLLRPELRPAEPAAEGRVPEVRLRLGDRRRRSAASRS